MIPKDPPLEGEGDREAVEGYSPQKTPPAAPTPPPASGWSPSPSGGGFEEFVAIDWSGQAVERPKGIAIARAMAGGAAPTLVTRETGWSRPDVLDWLVTLAESGTRALIGLDLSPALPFADAGAFFPEWAESPADAKELWRLVDTISEEDPHLAATRFVSHLEARRHFRQTGDCGDLFQPGRGRLRLCEHGQASMALSPSSCFNLVGASQVGKSSLTGMRVLHRLVGRIPVWPFDPVPETGPLIVEIYTSLAAREAGLRKGRSKIRDGETLDAALAQLGSAAHAPLARYDDHATDAILTAAWMRIAATRPALWSPLRMSAEIAQTEGWTFGVP